MLIPILEKVLLSFFFNILLGFVFSSFNFCCGIYFSALIDASEAYHQLADIKYQMEDNVKHNFLDPLAHLQQTDLKEVNVCLLVLRNIYCSIIM